VSDTGGTEKRAILYLYVSIERFHSDVIICLQPSLITSNVNHNSMVSNVLEVDSDAKVR